LRQVQQAMQAAIGIGPGEAAGEAVELIAASSTLSRQERLGLYRRSYRLRLLECMRSMHPGLQHALGGELFDAFALEYLEACPPQSYTLFDLDAGFPDYLQAHRPQSPPGEEPWPEFLVDLARLERLFLEVYDGAGSEGQRLPEAAGLPVQPSGQWLQARVSTEPSLRLLACSYPVAGYLLAVRSGAAPPLPLPAATHLALNRRNFNVIIHELGPTSYRVLRDLVAGASVADAAAAHASDPDRVWQVVLEGVGRGFFRAVLAQGDGQRVGPAGRGKESR
jgi:hypothetical protein